MTRRSVVTIGLLIGTLTTMPGCLSYTRPLTGSMLRDAEEYRRQNPTLQSPSFSTERIAEVQNGGWYKFLRILEFSGDGIILGASGYGLYKIADKANGSDDDEPTRGNTTSGGDTYIADGQSTIIVDRSQRTETETEVK